MPVYTYDCDNCARVVDVIVSYADRDGTHLCSVCKGELIRRGVSGFRLGKPRYQMAAVLPNGDHIPGHFGKDASRRRKK